MHIIFTKIYNVFTFVMTSPYHVGKSIYNHFKYKDNKEMRVEDTSQYKIMLQNRIKQEEELSKLIKYETIGERLNVEWNTEIIDVKYYKSKQNELKHNIALLEDTLKNVKDMNSVYYQGKSMMITHALNYKLKTLNDMVPQLEKLIQEKTKNSPTILNQEQVAYYFNLKTQYETTINQLTEQNDNLMLQCNNADDNNAVFQHEFKQKYDEILRDKIQDYVKNIDKLNSEIKVKSTALHKMKQEQNKTIEMLQNKVKSLTDQQEQMELVTTTTYNQILSAKNKELDDNVEKERIKYETMQNNVKEEYNALRLKDSAEHTQELQTLKNQYEQDLLNKNKRIEELQSAKQRVEENLVKTQNKLAVKQQESTHALVIQEKDLKKKSELQEMDYVQQLTTKEQEIDILKQENKEALERQESKHKKELEVHNIEYSSLSNQYNNATSSNNELSQEIALLNSLKSSKQLTDENDSFKNEIISLKTQNSTLTNENTLNKKALQVLQEKQLTFDKQHSIQNDEIEKLKTRATTTETFETLYHEQLLKYKQLSREKDDLYSLYNNLLIMGTTKENENKTTLYNLNVTHSEIQQKLTQ